MFLQGWRAPFLEMGGDGMFRAIQQLGLKYDSSWTTLKYTNWYEEEIPALWPYTLDYPSPQVCGGVWRIVTVLCVRLCIICIDISGSKKSNM